MRFLEEKERRERKDRFLQSVILEYIRTGQPVSSAALAKREEFNLSTATVRNLLHELETEGYLIRPHTSAGRVPTDRGYRYYVDYLINFREVLSEDQKEIERHYSQRIEESERLLIQTSKMLAYVSHYAGFVLRPKLNASLFQRVDFIPLSDDKTLFVLVATNGFIRYKITPTPSKIKAQDLIAFGRWLNQRFQGKSLREFCLSLDLVLEEDLRDEKRRREHLLECLEQPLREIERDVQDEELLLEGTSNVLSSSGLDFPPEYLRELSSMFDDRERLTSMLKREMGRYRSRLKKNRVAVIIGKESKNPLMERLSLITKTFETKEHTVGLLGILGPKRMAYEQMMALVENIQGALQKALNFWQEGSKDEMGEESKKNFVRRPLSSRDRTSNG